MAKKSDFTEQEWEQLRKGATGAGLLVSVSDRSFFDSFKEAGSLAKHLAAAARTRASSCATWRVSEAPDLAPRCSPQEIEAETVEALLGAVSTLQAKAPDEVEAYKSFVLEVAEAVGKAAEGGEAAEAATIEKIRAALA